MRRGLFLAAMALSGCANHPVDCAIGFSHADCLPGTAGYVDPKKFDVADDERCRSFGLNFGTAEYAQCRMNIDNQRTSTRNAILSSFPTPTTTTCQSTGSITTCRQN